MGLVAVGANLRSAPNAWLEITSHAGDDDEDDDDGDGDGGDGEGDDDDDGDDGGDGDGPELKDVPRPQ